MPFFIELTPPIKEKSLLPGKTIAVYQELATLEPCYFQEPGCRP